MYNANKRGNMPILYPIYWIPWIQGFKKRYSFKKSKIVMLNALTQAARMQFHFHFVINLISVAETGIDITILMSFSQKRRSHYTQIF